MFIEESENVHVFNILLQGYNCGKFHLNQLGSF